MLIATQLLTNSATTNRQHAPTDFEKWMIEEAAKVFVVISSVYKDGNPDMEYLESLFREKEQYRFMEPDTSHTNTNTFPYRIEDVRIRQQVQEREQEQSTDYQLTITVKKSGFEVILGPGTTHLFDFWDQQLIWRLGKAGILTTNKIEKNKDSGAVTRIYHPSETNPKEHWQI